jgi:hypothetical protein
MTPKLIKHQQIILDKYFAPKLSKKALRQMKSAAAKPYNQFAETMLFPQLVADVDGVVVPWLANPSSLDIDPVHRLRTLTVDIENLVDRPSYACLSASTWITARSQNVTLFALDCVADDTAMTLAEMQSVQTYFTNHMRFWAGDGDTHHQPSSRSVLGPLTVLTLEFDPPDKWDEAQKLATFEEQMRWLRRSGDTKASQPIQSIIKWAKGFSDFRGVCVTYSGHKSLHFHFAFDTSALCAAEPGLRDQYRPAYAAAHDELATVFTERLPLAQLEPDRGMREPERFRRLPNGTRTASSDKPHLFNVPNGTEVVQSVLFEEVLRKSPKGADKRMFDPIKIKQHSQSNSASPAKRSGRPSVGMWSDDAEHKYWVQQANALLANYADDDGFPRVSHFEMWGDGILLKLFACKGDKNAGGVLFEHSNTPVFTGSGKQPRNHVKIGLPLSFFIGKWQKAWRMQNPNASKIAFPKPTITPVVESRVDVADIDSARETSKIELWDIAQAKKTVLFKGPTGYGKTFTAMSMLPDLVRHWRDQAMKDKEHAPSFERDQITHYKSAIATATYEQADEKCEQFNGIHSGSEAVGVVFRSFDQIYTNALTCLYGDDALNHKITTDTASMAGQRSVISAIRSKQPVVWQSMADTHAAMLKPLVDAPMGSVLVLFMVHDVLHQWTEGGLSRLLSHKDFFSTDTDQLWTLADQTKLVVAVQDEVTDAHLLHLEKHRTVAWCERLFADDPKIWSDEFIHLSDARMHWEAFDGQEGSNGPPFNKVLSIWRLGLSTENEVGVGPVEPYCHDVNEPPWKMYRATHASSFVYQKRSWWDGLAEHTFILTTEHLPVMMFQSATKDQSDVAVYDLNHGPHPHGIVDVHTLGVLPSSANQELVTSIREECSGIFAIANKVKDLGHTLSPASAKGVNHLANEDILQIMNVVSPSEYSRMQVINLLYEFRSALKLRHIDQFNQTAGRNLGCRFNGHRHIAYMPTQLWKYLTNGSLSDFAFAMNLIETSEQRRDQRSNAEKQHLKRLADEEEELSWFQINGPNDLMFDQYAATLGMADLLEVAEVDPRCVDVIIDQQAQEYGYEDA